MDMHPDLIVLAFTLVLALVHIVWAAVARTKETGLKWNAGARDGDAPAPVGTLSGRLMRAQANLFETLPLFIGAVLIAQIAGKADLVTTWGAHLYFFGRLIYLPVYAFGVPYLRTLVWGVSVAGLIMILVALFV